MGGIYADRSGWLEGRRQGRDVVGIKKNTIKDRVSQVSKDGHNLIISHSLKQVRWNINTREVYN